MNGKLATKIPDWLYVAAAAPVPAGTDRRSYTPHLEGEVPRMVMEFLPHTDGDEYSAKPTFPPGKWFFYEQILQIPTYVLFASATGDLEVYQRQPSGYELIRPKGENRYWLADMGLFLGVWQGEKEARTGYWLRWWDEAGTLLPWAVEQVEQERDRVNQERDRADQERSRADQERDRASKLAEYLRSQGIDPSAL